MDIKYFSKKYKNLYFSVDYAIVFVYNKYVCDFVTDLFLLSQIGKQ